MSTTGLDLKEILEAVRWAQDEGWSIERGVCVNGTRKACCALGACAAKRRPSGCIDTVGELANELGIDNSWTRGFAAGFDDSGREPLSCVDSDAYDAGYDAGLAAWEAVSGKAEGP